MFSANVHWETPPKAICGGDDVIALWAKQPYKRLHCFRFLFYFTAMKKATTTASAAAATPWRSIKQVSMVSLPLILLVTRVALFIFTASKCLFVCVSVLVLTQEGYLYLFVAKTNGLGTHSVTVDANHLRMQLLCLEAWESFWPSLQQVVCFSQCSRRRDHKLSKSETFITLIWRYSKLDNVNSLCLYLSRSLCILK